MKELLTRSGKFHLPIYLPDATRAITKSIDSEDLKKANVKGVVVNTYHLMTTPGIQTLERLGGVKNFMNFNGLVVSDSGGWQVFSLIKRNGLPGKITDEGVQFRVGNKISEIFTPERSIQVQFAIGSDVMICLDDFVDPKANRQQNEIVVKRTIEWAMRSKLEFDRLCAKSGSNTKPLLFAVIQGGYDKDLRKLCAEKLIEIGFDGYGYGGYVIDEITGKLNLDISEYVVSLIPEDKYKFALGFGTPSDIVSLHNMGWEIFDCTLPTRDARHKRLYISDGSIDFGNNSFLYINKQIYANDANSIDNSCDCHTCNNYSRAYLHHLFKIKDITAFRLATIHNLRFYTRLIESIM